MTPLAIGGVIMRNLPGKQSTEWTVNCFLFLSFWVYISISTDHEEKNSLWFLQEKSNKLFSLRAGTSISVVTGKRLLCWNPVIMVDFIFNGQKRRFKKWHCSWPNWWVGGATGRYLAVTLVWVSVWLEPWNTSVLRPTPLLLWPWLRPYSRTVYHQLRHYKGIFLLNTDSADSFLSRH